MGLMYKYIRIMKVRHLAAVTATLSLFWSCGIRMDVPDSREVHTLRAFIESEGTRVSFNDTQGKLTWNTDDKIAVHVGSAFVLDVPIDIPSTGEFTIEEQEGSVRNFYAVYPSDVAVESTTLQVELPDSYDISEIVSGSGDTGDAYRRTSDYSPVPMVAENDTDNDILYFRHVGGLLRVHCGSVPSGVKTAMVAFDKDVTGTYAVNLANPHDPRITTGGTSSNNVVTFVVSAEGLASGTDFVLNVPVPCGTYESVTVTLDGDASGLPVSKVYDDTPLVFLRRHGKTLLFGDITFDFVVEGLEDVLMEYVGGGKNLAEFFYSYKTYGVHREAVPFRLEYSADGSTGWTTTAPEWLSVSANVDYSGSTVGESLGISVYPQTNTALDTHAADLKSRPEVTTRQDLSLFDVAAGAAVARTTANCYVVQAPGLYRIPAVYGNAIKGGITNRSAFQTKDKNGNWRTADDLWTKGDVDNPEVIYHGYYAYFKDHLNDAITTPWIKDKYAGTFTAKLLWTDEPGLVTDVSVTADKSFIDFKVPAETICQGNALLALFVDGAVAWSWHIWVTDEDLVIKDDGSGDGPNGYQFSPVNLGWCDTKDLQRYDERKTWVRAVQTVDGGAVSEAVTVTSKAGLTVVKGGNSPYYQWGRKDPLTPGYLRTKTTASSSSSTVEEKEFYAPDAAYQPEAHFTLWEPLGEVIQHPNLRYYYNGALKHGWNWFEHFVYNLWDSEYHETKWEEGNVPVKTVYDPCPVGYQVPSRKAFEGFAESNFPWCSLDGNDGRLYDGRIFFPFIGYRSSTNHLELSMMEYFTATKTKTNTGDSFSGMYLGFNGTYVFAGNGEDHLHASLPIRPVRER